MHKLKSLRTTLTNAIPALQSHPEMLHLSMSNGKIVSTLATSLSFENQYTLTLVITGFSGDIESIFVPLQAWLRVHQADIMTTEAGRQKGFTYFATVNDDDSLELSISLALTERILVKELDDELHAEYAPEPQPPEPVTRPMQLYVHGELVSEWDE